LTSLRERLEADARRAGVAGPLAAWGEASAGAVGERELDGTWSVGPAVELPLPVFNQGQADALEAQAALNATRQHLAAAAGEVRPGGRPAAAAPRRAHARALYCRDVLLPLQSRIVEETLKHYNGMQVGAFQLLEAKRRQIEAETRSIEALRDYWLAARLDAVL